MANHPEIRLKTIHESEVTFSYQQNLVMIHSCFISAQFSPNDYGVEVMHYVSEDKEKNIIDISLHPLKGSKYQRWTLKGDYKQVKRFFMALGWVQKQCYIEIPLTVQ